MIKYFKKFFLYIIILLLLVEPCYGYTVYSYSGIKAPTNYSSAYLYSGVAYSGTLYEPIIYNGVKYTPISNSGTLYNGVYYNGISLSEIKVTSLEITGNETSDDFFSDEVPEEYRVDWEKVIKKYAVGSSIIVVTGILTLTTGGTVGYICAGAFWGSLSGSLSGTLFGAIVEGTLSALKGDSSEQIFKAAIEGSADGFMWGAITGAVTGAVTSYSQIAKGTHILNSKGKIVAVVDDNSKVVFEPRTGKRIGIAKGQMKDGQYYCYFDDASNSYKTFDGIRLRNFKISDSIFSQGDEIVGVIDDSTGFLALGDDAYKLLMDKYAPIKSNPSIKILDNPLDYNGTISHAKVLKKNYELATGIKIPKNANGHHIVPWNDKEALRAREIFTSFGLKIDDAANCAILPSGSDALAKSVNMMNHARVHTNSYYSKLTDMLENCLSKEDVLDVLDLFREALYNNAPFWWQV